MADGTESAGRHGLPSRLAGEILAWARREGLEPGAHLTEGRLAEVFQVSRTPIRLALQVLEGEGTVERQRNRGFFLRAVPEPSAAVTKTADEDPLYFRIADDYLSGEIGPRVAESELLRRYGVPRSQLMRLLARMAREGWIERRRGQGWEFQPMLTSPEAYSQGYRFRLLIEPAALLEPGYRLDPLVALRLRAEQKAMLAGGWHSFSSAETHRIGAEFHEGIVGGSGNPFLIEALRRVNRMRRLIEYRAHVDRSRLVRISEEHLRILDLIEAGAMEEASAFLRVHLQGSRLAKDVLGLHARVQKAG
ncbi:GntR family transcriptional regulator [Roseomonas nepalensis]|uniref:GntR family transcriptional regulator n=1 Tax=Muricoccus nepalensis TaxID=1854500 RepID=A0A502F3W9_9PROT|nr:GntR family transcriptional regulator [Roseomonas nepalensis]TPG44828.1 GntR family transcriptional regulator [Roseomonas nepalensis]